MTSQQDETARRAAGGEMADDPIVIERHDEILTGDGPAAGEPADGDPAAGEPAAGEPAAGEPAAGEPAAGEPASDELIGRHAAPGTGGADPAPLVVPAEAPRADMSDAQAAGPAADDGQEFPEPVSPGAAPAGPADPGPAGFGVAADATQPGGTGTPAGPASVAGPPGAIAADQGPAAAVPGGGIPAAALSEQQWPAIQAMFVDDPQGSVQRAAAAADEVLRAFVASLEREQMALRASWEDESETTTEDLRTALQQYRAFCGRLEGLA